MRVCMLHLLVELRLPLLQALKGSSLCSLLGGKLGCRLFASPASSLHAVLLLLHTFQRCLLCFLHANNIPEGCIIHARSPSHKPGQVPVDEWL